MNDEIRRNGSKIYRWVITTLVGILGFSIGLIFQTDIKTQVVTNTVEIRTIKENLKNIETKLDKLIEMRK